MNPAAIWASPGSIKQAVDVPVIAVGRIEPELAERTLAAGGADFIAMGRKLLADPELPNKLAQNQARDIRPCIYCYTCVSEIFHSRHVICAVNAQTGREHERVLVPADRPRHVLVVGGGPAGMETARVAALRGHRVTLCERAGRLGGTVFFAAIAYAPNERVMTYLARQLRTLAVTIRTDTVVDASVLQALQPDVVVLATGALRAAPPLPGTDQKHVFSGDELRQLMTGDKSAGVAGKLNNWQRCLMWAGALLGITRQPRWIRYGARWWMPLGRRVAIIGGGLVGVELAEFLLQRGRQVTVLEEGEKFAVELAVVRRWRVLHELREHGAVLVNNTRVIAIVGHSLQLQGSTGEQGSAGEQRSITADTVILAAGAQANSQLTDVLEAGGIEYHRVGDCSGVGYIQGAIEDGYQLGAGL